MDRTKMTRQPSHPGEILKVLYMEPLGISVSDLASTLKIPTETLSKIIDCEGSVTVDIAMRLGQAFGCSPESWLNAQRNLDLWKAEQGEQAWRRIRPLVKKEQLTEDA